MKKLLSLMIVVSMIFTSGITNTLACSLNEEAQIIDIEKEKNDILSTIKMQLEKQGALSHYKIYETIVDREFKLIKEDAINSKDKNNLVKKPVEPGFEFAPYGGEVNYEMKSIDYGYALVATTYLCPKDTIKILDELDSNYYVLITEFFAGVTIPNYIANSLAIKSLLTQIGIGITYGFPILMYDLYTSIVRNQINQTPYKTSKVTYVETPDGIKSCVAGAWEDYKFMPIPVADGDGIKNVSYIVY